MKLLSVWVEVGLDPDHYWHTTPLLCSQILNAAVSRRTYEHNELVWLAWNTAAFARQKKLPQMSNFLLKDRTKQIKQNWKQQLAAAKLITAMMGGKKT